MAIKDIPGPGFVGTTTIKWIVTRGFSIGGAAPVTPPDMPGIEYRLTDARMHYLDAGGRMHYRTTDERTHYRAGES